MAHKRKFMVQLSAVPPGRPQTITVERQNILLVNGWLVLSNGSEFEGKTDVIAYPAHRVLHVEEVESLTDVPAENPPPDPLAKLARADKNKSPRWEAVDAPVPEDEPDRTENPPPVWSGLGWDPGQEDLRGL